MEVFIDKKLKFMASSMLIFKVCSSLFLSPSYACVA